MEEQKNGDHLIRYKAEGICLTDSNCPIYACGSVGKYYKSSPNLHILDCFFIKLFYRGEERFSHWAAQQVWVDWRICFMHDVSDHHSLHYNFASLKCICGSVVTLVLGLKDVLWILDAVGNIWFKIQGESKYLNNEWTFLGVKTLSSGVISVS